MLGFLCFKLFNRMNSVFPHTRRLPILGLALCFGLSYISEKYFGIADITGAYVAGRYPVVPSILPITSK